MGNTITLWRSCRYGGKPGSNGHRVHPDKMGTMHVGKMTIAICIDCKARKIDARHKMQLKPPQTEELAKIE